MSLPRKRVTPLHTRGEPMVWLTGVTLSVALFMITALLAVVLWQGGSTFLVRGIERVELAGAGAGGAGAGGPGAGGPGPGGAGPGETFLGIAMKTEAYDPGPEERAELERLREAGALPAGSVDASGRPLRTLYRVGNSEVRAQPFLWAPHARRRSAAVEPWAVFVERESWGPWLGLPEAIVRQETRTLGADEAGRAVGEVVVDGVPRRLERTAVRTLEDGSVQVRERVFLAEGPQAVLEAFPALHAAARARAAEMADLSRHTVGRISRASEAARLRVRAAEMALARAESEGRAGGAGGGRRWPAAVWGLATLLGVAGVVVGGRRLVSALGAAAESGVGSGTVSGGRWGGGRGWLRGRRGGVVTAACLTVGVVGLLAGWLTGPLGGAAMTGARLEAIRAEVAAETARLEDEAAAVRARLAELDAEDARWRVIFREVTTGRFAPTRQTEPEEPLRVSAVVRVVAANQLSQAEAAGVVAARWWEFVSARPRNSNTEGGIFPVIFGTVMLTMLLSVIVVPLGVVAALYLREYAKQGPLVSAVRIAINNLAGVPSIVYGVFGLGFFCYTLGGWVDGGPESPMGAGAWWLAVAGVGGLVVLAVGLSLWGVPRPGAERDGGHAWLMRAGGLVWVGAAAGAVWVVWTTPYFGGLFPERSPSPTFGTKGLLWATLTLALLTLPVVIVATEEAIAAVPRSMREGSYGCGATKWQTIQRIVLPRAMPGIMTGMILAMARGAGEVAPLMLVGVVKKAEELPVGWRAPFVYLEQSFMHLGFHIYDVGFQSPDSEAARPLVWCTTLVLLLVVVALNLAAIRLRARLRRKFLGEAF